MFLFNTFKHHLPSIIQYLRQPNNLTYLNDLLCIGDSQMDLYTGDLTVAEITQEIKHFLDEADKFDKASYTDWIKQNGFVKIQLSDTSDWILLLGNTEDQYVHIHPARYSPRSVRVKASTLKTVLALTIEMPDLREMNTSEINEIRKKIKLSPIKNIEESYNIEALYTLIKNRSTTTQ
jgi:hypothetical protein